MKQRLLSRFGVICLGLIFAASAMGATEVLNGEDLRQKLAVERYLQSPNIKNLKIAILDNGFMGFVPNRGMLPDSAEVINPTQIGAAPSSHGLAMAQIIWTMTGKTVDGPKFYLVNTNGFSNLKAAVQFVIDSKVDLVLYSQNWNFGGNFDGRGFVNAQVSRAVDQGILWINSAGNNHKLVRNAAILSASRGGDYLQFGAADRLRFENRLDENEVNITLSWSDFQDTDAYHTQKDLDLFVFDQQGNQVGSSELIQRGQAPDSENPGLSSHAREQLKLSNLDRGTYFIAVKRQSNNFISTDQLRLLLFSEKLGAVDFKDRSFDGEIMPPADHPRVITVGDFSGLSAEGPTRDGRIKPDVWLNDVRVVFSNGAEMRGSSAAAALMAGCVALLRAQRPNYSQAELSSYLHLLKSSGNPVEPGLKLDSVNNLDVTTRTIMPPQSKVMRHSAGYIVILTPNDPLAYDSLTRSGAKRINTTDIVVYSPNDRRWLSYPAAAENRVIAPLIIFRKSRATAAPVDRAVWRMP